MSKQLDMTTEEIITFLEKRIEAYTLQMMQAASSGVDSVDLFKMVDLRAECMEILQQITGE